MNHSTRTSRTTRSFQPTAIFSPAAALPFALLLPLVGGCFGDPGGGDQNIGGSAGNGGSGGRAGQGGDVGGTTAGAAGQGGQGGFVGGQGGTVGGTTAGTVGGAVGGTTAGTSAEPEPCDDNDDCNDSETCTFWVWQQQHSADSEGAVPPEADAIPMTPPECFDELENCTDDTDCAEGEQCHNTFDDCGSQICGPSCPEADCETDDDCGGEQICQQILPVVEVNNDFAPVVSCPSVKACRDACDPEVHGCRMRKGELECDHGPCGNNDLNNFCQADGTCGSFMDCTVNYECLPDLQQCKTTGLASSQKPYCDIVRCDSAGQCGGEAPYCVSGQCQPDQGACR